ncbi:unnamed protein product [Knipowitschia caucasica]
MDANGTRSSSRHGSPVHSTCPTPEVSPSENRSCSSDSLEYLSTRRGTVIPNRIFVGGVNHKVCESDLWNIFSQYGTVSEVNIIQNQSRPNNRYGFVTFENPGDAQRLLLDVNRIYYKDNRLIIRPAVRKLRGSGNLHRPSSSMVPVPCGAMYLTTSSGIPYTIHNGVAYFHSPRGIPSPHLWTSQPAPAMLPQPCQHVYQQPSAYPQHYQPRCFQNQYQWINIESPVGSGPVMYPQPEYLYHVPEGFSAYDSSEHYDAMLHQSYSMYPLRAERPPRFMPQEYGKGHMYPSFPLAAPPAIPYYDQGEAEAQTMP